MTLEKQQENIEHKEHDNSSVDEQLLQLKKDFAKEYFAKLQWDDWSLPWLLLSETGAVEDYLTSEWVFDSIKDKVVIWTLLQKILEKDTMDKLDAVKSKIDRVSKKDLSKATQEIEKIKQEVWLSVVADVPVQKDQEEVDQSIQTIVEDKEKYSSRKEKLFAILDKILDYDKKNSVKYNRWGRESLKTGLDCSGLIIYALRQIWLKEMWWDSRAMFSSLETEKIENNLDGVNPGDLIFWDSKNKDYKFSSGDIPTIKKDWEKYRIHHVAFVKDVNNDWTITVVESNWANWVVERKISLEEEKKKKHKSDLYVGSVDYDRLMAYTGPKENILEQVA